MLFCKIFRVAFNCLLDVFAFSLKFDAILTALMECVELNFHDKESFINDV